MQFLFLNNNIPKQARKIDQIKELKKEESFFFFFFTASYEEKHGIIIGEFKSAVKLHFLRSFVLNINQHI